MAGIHAYQLLPILPLCSRSSAHQGLSAGRTQTEEALWDEGRGVSNKLMSIAVRGKSKEWTFSFYADPRYVEEWRSDGLEIYVIENTVPMWVPSPLIRAWCFLQDTVNFKWLR